MITAAASNGKPTRASSSSFCERRRFVRKLEMGDYGVHYDYSNSSSKNMFATGLMQVSSKVGLAVGIALGLASVCGWWYAALLRRSEAKNSNKKSPLPPGSFGLPLLGETLEYLRLIQTNKSAEFFTSRVAKYGQVGAQNPFPPCSSSSSSSFFHEPQLLLNLCIYSLHSIQRL